MTRPSISQKDIHSMDMGLVSTGLMMPESIAVDPLLRQGIKTFIPHIDSLFGKLIPGQVIAASGTPGSGKTTFFMGLLSLIAHGLPDDTEFSDDELAGVNFEPKTCAYISAEERIDFLKDKTDRFGINNIFLANESTVEGVEELIRSNELDVVVVDSLQALSSKYVDGEAKVIKYAGNILTKVAKDTNTVVIVICHSTTTGKIKGGSKFPHQADTQMKIVRLGGDVRQILTEKNRMGRTGDIGLSMGAHGYDFHTLHAVTEEDTDSEGNGGRKSESDEWKEAIVDQISLADEDGMDFSELSKLCDDEGMDIGKAERLMRELVANGTLTRTGTRRHNFKWMVS